MIRLLIVALILTASQAFAATKTLKPLKTWKGQMPVVVQPLMQSSVATSAEWQRAWSTCQMKGAPDAVDFDKRIVLVAVRRGSEVTFSSIKLDSGNVTMSVAVTPDMPSHYTCAFAMIDRTGVTTVNGAPLGK